MITSIKETTVEQTIRQTSSLGAVCNSIFDHNTLGNPEAEQQLNP